jgi:hypothetical protein
VPGGDPGDVSAANWGVSERALIAGASVLKGSTANLRDLIFDSSSPCSRDVIM